MLRRLFVKDLQLNPHLFWGVLPFFAWIAYAVREDGAPVGMLTTVSALMGAATAATVAAREDRFHATALLASLPVARTTLVLSRYALAAAAGGAAFVTAALLAALLPWSPHPMSAIFDARSVLMAIVFIGASTALLLPLALRFGLVGVVGFFAILQVGGVGLFFLSSAFGMREPMRAVFGGAESLIKNLYASLSAPGAAVLVLAAVAGAGWLSYRTSVWLVARRDL
jgi:hypothetical protein